MKRYIIGLTLASALTMGLTSCSDFLEEPIRGQQDMENYFTTEEECEKQITGCYNFIACDDWWQIYKFYNLCNITTDDCWMGNTTQDPGEYRVAAMFTGNTIDLGTELLAVSLQGYHPVQHRHRKDCTTEIQRREVSEAPDCRG